MLSKLFLFVMSYTTIHPCAFLKYACDMDLNLSWPAVSHIYTLMTFSSIFRVFILKSTPTVQGVVLKISSANLSSKLVLPESVSPIKTILYSASRWEGLNLVGSLRTLGLINSILFSRVVIGTHDPESGRSNLTYYYLTICFPSSFSSELILSI